MPLSCPLHLTAAAACPPAATAVAPGWVWLLLLTAGAVATITDLRSMRIPNWLTLPLLAAGLTYGGFAGGWDGLRAALAGAGLAGGIYVAAYIIAGGGAGDAKLMLAIGSWLDFRQAMVVVAGVSLCGFVWAIAVIARRSGLRDVPAYLLGGLGLTYFQVRSAMRGRPYHIGKPSGGNDLPQADQPTKRPKHWYPYAPAIFCGTILAWLYLNHFGYLR